MSKLADLMVKHGGTDIMKIDNEEILPVIPEHPILFSAEMVRAILDGRKTQTRRVIKFKPDKEPVCRYAVGRVRMWDNLPKAKDCPYGKLGDRLWVRETFYRHGKWIKNGLTKTGKQAWRFKATKHDDGEDVRLIDNPPEIVRPNKYRKPGWYKRPSIFMPRWASRILLEVTDVRVERVHEIGEKDSFAEGCHPDRMHYGPCNNDHCPCTCRGAFARLWDSINAKRGFGWSENPWVWVVAFRRIKP